MREESELPSPAGSACALLAMLAQPETSSDAASSPAKAELKKARAKYRSRILNQLRREIGVAEAAHLKQHVTINSAPDRLASVAMQTALSYDLIRLGIETIECFQEFEWYDLSSALALLRRTPRESSHASHDIATACAIAIGARRSMHSAVLGANLGRHSDLISLGRRREAVCSQLALRACRLATESPLAARPSDKCTLSVLLLRLALKVSMPAIGPAVACEPVREHNLDLVRAIQNNPRLRIEQDGHVLLYDASASLTISEGPVWLQSALKRLGWNQLPSLDALLAIDGHSILAASRATLESLSVETTLVGMREINFLHHHALLSAANLAPTFAKLNRLADNAQALAGALTGHLPPEERAAFVVLRAWMPLELECALFQEAGRQASSRSPAVWHTAQVRFLGHLRKLAAIAATFPLDSFNLHMSATLFTLLDHVDDWTGWAVWGAREHSSGSGPIASAGFTLIDLATLYAAVKQAASIFASLGDRATELGEGLSALQAGNAAEKPAIAEGMVRAALEELAAA